jgi:hypothetical protein
MLLNFGNKKILPVFRNMEGNETLLFDKGDGVEMSCMVRLVHPSDVRW